MSRFNLEDYEPVESRIARFWEQYPNGRIHTELVHFDDTQFIIRALIYRDAEDSVPATIDYAHEVVGSSPVNRNFALSNGCTSAIGRALADLNFAPKGKRPSREEMAKVNQVNESESEEAKNLLKSIAEAENIDALTAMADLIKMSSSSLSERELGILRSAFINRKEVLERV